MTRSGAPAPGGSGTPPLADIRAAARRASAADHAGTIRAYFPHWDTEVRPSFLRAVDALPASGFDFKPRPEMLTAREMIVHVAETERGWIHQVVDGGPYEEWVVPHEDPSQGWRVVVDAPDHATLHALLERWHEPTRRWLDRPASELDRVISRTGRGGDRQRLTLHWILHKAQEHEVHHRAQLHTYLRLMGVEPPAP